MGSERYAEELKREGVVIIEDFFDESAYDELYDEISTIIENRGIDVAEADEYDYDNLVNWGVQLYAQEQVGMRG